MRQLVVRMTRAFDGGPLAVVENLPGDGAELRPRQLRALALVLSRIADDVEKRRHTHRGRPLPDERRAFPVDM